LTFTSPGQLLVATGTITTSSKPAISITQTWNDGAVAFTGLKLNITNTASAATSRTFDFQVGGVTAFYHNPSVGELSFTGDTALVNPTFRFRNAGGGSIGFIVTDGTTLSMGATGQVVGIKGSGAFVASTAAIGWTSGSTTATIQTWFAQDAAGIIAQQNATNAQTFRVYNTFTDASNYERGVIDWTTTANRLTIGTQAAGTGTLRL